MPSSSKKQHNLMAAVANNPAFAKKVGISQSVGKDFIEADKGKKFGKGGMSDASMQAINKAKTNHGASALFKKGGTTMATRNPTNPKNPRLAAAAADRMARQSAPAPAASVPPSSMSSDLPYGGMKKGGKTKEDASMKTKKMAAGGITTAKMGKVTAGGKKAFGEHSVQAKGHTKGTQVKMSGSTPLGMKKGGKS